MRKKLATSKIVRKRLGDIPPTTAADLARLRDAMKCPIDTSEIPERKGALQRLRRDSTGKLPARKSAIRDAIIRELEHFNMTPYRLWKEAKTHCPTLSQSAVHEFIKGQRQLELPYAEALMAAVGLGVVRVHVSMKQRPTLRGSSGSNAATKRSSDRSEG
jgi:hypothetical protein